MARKSSYDGIFGSHSQFSDNIAIKSKYSNGSVINAFRKLDNTEPVVHRGTIQSASGVNSNLNANIVLNTKVSDSFVSGVNMDTVFCCEALQEQLGQKHVCLYLNSIVHEVDILCIESFNTVIQCLYLYPALGDNMQGFLSGTLVTVISLGWITYPQVR